MALPRWLIDDTTGRSEDATYMAHLHQPRFAGQILWETEVAEGETSIYLFDGLVIGHIEWFDTPAIERDLEALSDSAQQAWLAFDAATEDAC